MISLSQLLSQPDDIENIEPNNVQKLNSEQKNDDQKEKE